MRTAYKLNIIWCLCTFPFPFLSASSHKWCLWYIACTINVSIFITIFTPVECLPSTLLLKKNQLTLFSIETNCEQTFYPAISYKNGSKLFFCTKAQLPLVSITKTKDCKGRCIIATTKLLGILKGFLVIKWKLCPQITENSLLYFWFEKSHS